MFTEAVPLINFQMFTEAVPLINFQMFTEAVPLINFLPQTFRLIKFYRVLTIMCWSLSII